MKFAGKLFFFCTAILWLNPTQATPRGADLAKAPKSFQVGGKTYVPIDFETSQVDITFDVATKQATGVAHITFYAAEEGYPFLDLVPEPTSVTLNKENLGDAGMPLISTPNHETKVRGLISPVAANSTNTLEVEYTLEDKNLGFKNSGVQFGLFMTDLSDRGYLENYAPANYEFDQFSMRLTAKIVGASSTHQMFTNGKVLSESDTSWDIQFPSYFTTSSFFFHVSNAELHAKSTVYHGLTKDIPITVYAAKEAVAEDELVAAQGYMKELEGTFGPFAHEKYVAYITPDGGGMEYCGATMTSSWALGHEMTHSWFARGVMPANGNAGWIDEAIASWRDQGFQAVKTNPSSHPVNLAGFSEYRRYTPMQAYSEGAALIARLNHEFERSGGMKHALSELFKENQRTTITTPYFEKFLEDISGVKITSLFERFVYGKGGEEDPFVAPSPATLWGRLMKMNADHKHPRPYTAEELVKYR